MYAVKEIFYTLQGEGAQTGRAAVFCRFAGCNLWSGREADRATAICRFCDTDFADTDGPGGGKFASAEALAAAIEQTWPAGAESGKRFVVCTGGEPLLQLDAAAHRCAARARLRNCGRNQRNHRGAGGDRLDLRQPEGRRPNSSSAAETSSSWSIRSPELSRRSLRALTFRHFFLQPMDGPERDANTQAALRYCLDHPQWRLSLQTHKMLGIP